MQNADRSVLSFIETKIEFWKSSLLFKAQICQQQPLLVEVNKLLTVLEPSRGGLEVERWSDNRLHFASRVWIPSKYGVSIIQ